MNHPAWLEWMESLMGGVSRQSYTATLPPDRFHCVLDELPLHLIPKSRVHSASADDEGAEFLFLNPECVFTRAGDLPDQLCSAGALLPRLIREGFALQGTVAWVADPGGNLLPFWLGPRLESVLQGIEPGDPVPTSMPHGARWALESAGVLHREGRAGRNGSDRTKMIEAASALFREKGYAPLSGLLHPFHVAALRRYYRYRIRTGAIALGDKQSSLRYAAHQEPVARFFHHQLAAGFSAIAGEPLTPSYTYLGSYVSGAELEKHTDRPQCEFSITLCADFSPEPRLAAPWPIYLETPTGQVAVYQCLGDGLAYRGTRLPHFRDVLGRGRTSTSIFFHYVGADFQGPMD